MSELVSMAIGMAKNLSQGSQYASGLHQYTQGLEIVATVPPEVSSPESLFPVLRTQPWMTPGLAKGQSASQIPYLCECPSSAGRFWAMR
ncbi:unnamed protein product, partial [Clonostachys byssicola]